MGSSGRSHNFLIGGIASAQPDILHNGLVKEHDILEHNGIVLEQRFGFYRFNIHAAQGNGPGVRIPKAGRQFRGGGLAAAGRTYQRRDLALLCHKGHALQNRLLIVGEHYILKLNVVALVIADIGAGLLRGRVDLLHPLDADKGGEHFCHQHEATGEWVVNAAGKQQEQDEHGDGQRTGCHQNASHQHNRHKAKPKDELSCGRCGAGSDLVAEGTLHHIIQLLFQPFQVFFFTGAGLQLLNGIKVFLHAVVGSSFGIHIGALGIGLGFLCRKDYQGRHRHRHYNAKAHPPVKRQKADGRYHKHENRSEELRDRIGEYTFQGCAVPHDGGGQVRKIALAKEGQRQLSQLLRQDDPAVGAFLISHGISFVVLEPLGQKHNDKHDHCTANKQGCMIPHTAFLPGNHIQQFPYHHDQQADRSNQAQIAEGSGRNSFVQIS